MSSNKSATVVNLLPPDKELEMVEDVAKLKSVVYGNGRPGVFDVIKEVQQDVTEVKEDVSEVKEDVSNLKNDVGSMQKDVTHIKCTLENFIDNRETTCPVAKEKIQKDTKKSKYYKRAEFWIATITGTVMIGVSVTSLILAIMDKT